jgi:hypothetical protein
MRQRGQTIVSLITVKICTVLTIQHFVLTDPAAVQYIVRDISFDIAARRQPLSPLDDLINKTEKVLFRMYVNWL